MTTNEISSMSSSEIVGMLIELRPSDEAVAFLASLISSGESFAAVRELRRRFVARETSPAENDESSTVGAGTVEIDPDKFRAFFASRRIPLSAIGGLFGRSEGWGSVMLHRRRAGFYALDALACALDLHVDDLILAIGSERERQRVALAS